MVVTIKLKFINCLKFFLNKFIRKNENKINTLKSI